MLAHYRLMQITDSQTYETAGKELHALMHRDAHERNLSPAEAERLAELSHALQRYEDDAQVYHSLFRRHQDPRGARRPSPGAAAGAARSASPPRAD
jgi:hypothetical protein